MNWIVVFPPIKPPFIEKERKREESKGEKNESEKGNKLAQAQKRVI